jgi:alkylhydroperoxidase/carboxymuconolactone decarboxylase family protein YurZ
MNSILNILSLQDLRDLRNGYNRDFLNEKAAKMIGYEKAEGLAGWVADVIYKTGDPNKVMVSSLDYYQREIAILAVTAAQRDTFVMSGHVYWLLMELLKGPCANEELSAVAKVADVLLTAAAYTGVNNFRLSRTVLVDVLNVLKASCAAGITDTPQILVKMMEKFPPR